jgi:hypothetical protein
VNGIEADKGAAEREVYGGDRIWWDYRDWTAAMRVPAVVGSWPEPFLHGFRGERWGTTVDCHARAATCGAVSDRLSSAGVGSAGSDGNRIAVEVGTWRAVRMNPDAALLAQGPDRSGVFARFVGDRRPLLELFDRQGQPAGSIGKGGGLVAVLRPGDGPPTWVVTGTDEKGVSGAARLLGDALRNQYAVATQPGVGAIGVPAP